MRNGIDCKGKKWSEINLKTGMKDYSNQSFNRLTALFPIKFNNYVGWLCKCECGKEIALITNKITSGATKSCGCLQKEKAKQRWNNYRKENVKKGTRFGKLTLINFIKIENNEAIYHFKCDCGNELDKSLHSVKSNNIQSCGCLVQEKKNNYIESFINKKFGKLTVKSYLRKDKNFNYVFLCECECGNLIEVTSNSLQSENTTSCGCTRSIGENNIEKILKENNILYKKQYSFPDLFSYKKGRLFYDFAILDENNNVIRLIEFDGLQHKYAYDFFGGEEKLKITKENDKIKNQYAKIHNIPLIRIPYEYKNKITLATLFANDNIKT